MTEIDKLVWKRLLTSVGVSSLAATFLNVGVSTLDHPRAFEEPSALFLPAAVGSLVFFFLQLALLSIFLVVDRRRQQRGVAWTTVTGTLACVTGAMAPVVTVLARDATGYRALALWVMLGTEAIGCSVAAFVISGRERFSPTGVVAAALPLAGLEVCLALWVFEFQLGGVAPVVRAGALVLAGAVVLITVCLSGRLYRPGPSFVAGALFALLFGGAMLSLRSPADVATARFNNTPAKPKAVVLVTVDTLRPDMIGGTESGAKTPAITALMEDSVVFNNARSSAPWTKPSMASLLTGLSPAVHGVTNRRTRLADEIVTLAEHMNSIGYRTLGLGLNAHLEPLYNFGQGFDLYAFPARDDWGVSVGSQVLTWLDPHAFPELSPTTEAIADVAVEWIRASADEPFFLWIHILDPHWPYEPPAEWVDEGAHPRFGMSWGDHETVTNVQAGNTKIGPDDREFVRALYRGEIRYADANIGRVVDELKTLGLYEDSLIVFASDHGEEFWEHGTYEHGHTLYEEVLRVPLAFKLPHSKYTDNIASAVSTESVTPTMLDILGARFDPDLFSAEVLTRFWKSQDVRADPIFATGTYYYDEKQAVVADNWKLIHNLGLDQYELYNLEEDPGELDSRYYVNLERRERLKKLLFNWEKGSAELRSRLKIPDATVVLDRTQDARLRDLGYAGDVIEDH
jgi:arylsulfatase A-like enzyme